MVLRWRLPHYRTRGEVRSKVPQVETGTLSDPPLALKPRFPVN